MHTSIPLLLALALNLGACGGSGSASKPVSSGAAQASPVEVMEEAPEQEAPEEETGTEAVEQAPVASAENNPSEAPDTNDASTADENDAEEAPAPASLGPEPFKATKADLAQCAPAIDVLVDLTESIDASIHRHMRSKRRALIKKCKRRLTKGDEDFHRDVQCVANSGSVSELVNCDGWTDWPAM